MMPRSIPVLLRGELVRAAESVLDKQGSLPRNPENSQLSRLVQVANEAACADEIANYLRYQGARGRWRRSLAESVIGGIEPLLASLESEQERLAAWAHYANFLRRAYYYRREVSRDQERTRRREGTPPRGAGAGAPAAHGAEEGGGKRRRARKRRRPGAPGEESHAPDAEAAAGADAPHEGEARHESDAPHESAGAEYAGAEHELHGAQDESESRFVAEGREEQEPQS